MSAKYYTQFILTDAQYRGGNEFSGVIELSQPMDSNTDTRDIEEILARNFDLAQSDRGNGRATHRGSGRGKPAGAVAMPAL